MMANETTSATASAGQQPVDPEISLTRSPSGPEWSYDAPIRCLSGSGALKPFGGNHTAIPYGRSIPLSASLPILSLLNTQKFSLNTAWDKAPDDVCTLGSPSTTPYESSTDHVIPMGPNTTGPASVDTMKSGTDAANKTHMMAGLVLLSVSGIMDAALISYVIWLKQSGFTTAQLLMNQGIVQVVLCLLFGLVTATMMAKGGAMSGGLHRSASFRSLVLPFSSEYIENPLSSLSVVRMQQRKIMNGNLAMHRNKYGALSDLKHPAHSINSKHSIHSTHTTSHNLADLASVQQEGSSVVTTKQLVMAVSTFGIIQFTSHLTFFNGYLDEEIASGDIASDHLTHFGLAPLFYSVAIGLAFLWSNVFYGHSLNSELLTYLFVMYIGVAVCGYSFVIDGEGGMALWTRKSNAFLVFSALLESVAYIVIKYAHRVPTFLLVLAQSLCCAVLGVVMVSLSDEVRLPIATFSELIEVTSVGVLGFWTTWTFVRGTQLVSIGTASFVKVTVFIVFSIVIQVFSIEGRMPHFYCVFGVCLIALSIVLVLIEKFSKFQ